MKFYSYIVQQNIDELQQIIGRIKLENWKHIEEHVADAD